MIAGEYVADRCEDNDIGFNTSLIEKFVKIEEKKMTP